MRAKIWFEIKSKIKLKIIDKILYFFSSNYFYYRLLLNYFLMVI